MLDVTGEVFCEKAARKIRKIHRKTTGMKPIFVKLQTKFSTLLKKTPSQVFSCEFWEMFQNRYSKEQLQVTAYVIPM